MFCLDSAGALFLAAVEVVALDVLVSGSETTSVATFLAVLASAVAVDLLRVLDMVTDNTNNEIKRNTIL